MVMEFTTCLQLLETFTDELTTVTFLTQTITTEKVWTCGGMQMLVFPAWLQPTYLLRARCRVH